MNNAAVVAALMRGNPGLFFKNGDLELGESLERVHRGREANDARSYNCKVNPLVRHVASR
jgi:hypothetical protein